MTHVRKLAKYSHYSQTPTGEELFCGACDQCISGVYGHNYHARVRTPDDLLGEIDDDARRHEAMSAKAARLHAGEIDMNEYTTGNESYFDSENREYRYFAFCPWCGTEFDADWWKSENMVIENERPIDHYQNPGHHKGDQHEFRGSGPECMQGHWLGVSGGDKLCWCDPEVEPGIMGCTIRHRAITYKEYEASEAKKEKRRRAAKRRKQQPVPTKEKPGVVWLAEHRDYDQSYVSDAGVSVAAVIAAIKEGYGKPYVVDWEPPERDGKDAWSLTGHFESVPGYSTEHTATWSIYKQAVGA